MSANVVPSNRPAHDHQQGPLELGRGDGGLTKPDRIDWCDGSEEEKRRLTEEAVAPASLMPLNQKKLPGCYLHRSNPNDVARVEHLTFICTPTKDEAGPTNNWMAPDEAYEKLGKLFDGSMKGRTMYVVPYVMGPLGSPIVEGRHRAHRQRLRRAQHAHHDAHGQSRARHARRQRTTSTAACTRLLDCNPERRFICHFPQDNTIWSVGTGYGGNVLLGKKCLALRIGSYLGKQRGLARRAHADPRRREPRGRDDVRRGGVPERVRQDELRDDDPAQALQGLEDLDRRRRHRVDARRRRTAGSGRSIPRPATSASRRARASRSNPNAMKTIAQRHDLHQRRAHAGRRRVVGGQGRRGRPRELTDWQGQPVDAERSTEKAAHPNSRFTAPATNNPCALASSPTIPRACRSARSSSAAAARRRCRSSCRRSTGRTACSSARRWARRRPPPRPGKVGVVRRDPMAMLPFCGYNMGEYFAHWLRHAVRASTQPPKIFMVNWFRKDKDGKFLWPGFGENMRVLKWIVDRARGLRRRRRRRVFGWVPRAGRPRSRRASTSTPSGSDAATDIDLDEWQNELESQGEFFDKIGPTMPRAAQAPARAADGAHRSDQAQGLRFACRARRALRRVSAARASTAARRSSRTRPAAARRPSCRPGVCC